jgi:hypothetical protein
VLRDSKADITGIGSCYNEFFVDVCFEMRTCCFCNPGEVSKGIFTDRTS